MFDVKNIHFHFSVQLILNQREFSIKEKLKKYNGCHEVNYSAINYRFLSISRLTDFMYVLLNLYSLYTIL